MVVEILFPESCNLYGDGANAAYLRQTLPEAEFIYTAITDEPYFAKNEPDFIYMGGCSESTQRRIIAKLMPLKDRILELVDKGVVFLATGIYFMYIRWNYNALEAGYDTAKSLGVNTHAIMITSMAICSLAAAVAVSFVGIISFVGLIAPHVMRYFTGNDHRYLIPGSAIAGALLLVLADTIAKVVMPPVILPIGALMSFVGGPVFLFLLFKEKNANG